MKKGPKMCHSHTVKKKLELLLFFLGEVKLRERGSQTAQGSWQKARSAQSMEAEGQDSLKEKRRRLPKGAAPKRTKADVITRRLLTNFTRTVGKDTTSQRAFR